VGEDCQNISGSSGALLFLCAPLLDVRAHVDPQASATAESNSLSANEVKQRTELKNDLKKSLPRQHTNYLSR